MCFGNFSASDRPLVSVIVQASKPSSRVSKCVENILRNSSHSIRLIVARSVNFGALEARGTYICFLREGTLVQRGWLDALLEILKRFHMAAVVSSNKYPKRFSCLIMPRTVMGCIGPLDKGLAFDEAVGDYLLKAKRRGYKGLEAKSRLILVGGEESTRRLMKGKIDLRAGKRVRFEKRLSASKQEIEWRLRQYLLSHHQVLVGSKDSHKRLPPRKFVLRPASKFIRTGYAIRSQDGTAIEAVASLFTLESYAPDDLSKMVWSLLDGSRSLEEISALVAERSHMRKTAIHEEVRRRVHALMSSALIAQLPQSFKHPALVTVMMPAHNAERWIGEAIESVLTQTFPSFELIIVDDGSTDRTFEVAQRYLWNPKVRLCQNPRQLGIAAARNQVLSLARGKYIAICDADDLMGPRLLERFVGILEAHPDAGWVYGERLKIDAQGRPLKIDPVLPEEGPEQFRRNIVASAGALIRKAAMIKAGGYDESLLSAEDYVLALRMAKHTRFLAVSGEVHYLWRRHPESVSETNPWAMREPVRQGIEIERKIAATGGRRFN